MIIKRQPEELDRKPFISEEQPGKPEAYLGRVIIEFWCEDPEGCEEPAFAWSVDDPDQPDDEWIELFISGLKGAARHIEDAYRYRQKSTTP
jgi:hypothetical protein